MPHSAYLPKLYIFSRDSNLYSLVSTNFSNLGISVIQYKQTPESLLNARYFLLDLRGDFASLNLDTLCETLTKNKLKTIVILPSFIASDKSKIYEEMLMDFKKLNFTIVFVGLVVNLNIKQETKNEILLLEPNTIKAVSTDCLIEFLEKCLFSSSFNGQSIEIGNAILLGVLRDHTEYVKLSELVEGIHFLPESKLSTEELRNLAQKIHTRIAGEYLELNQHSKKRDNSLNIKNNEIKEGNPGVMVDNSISSAVFTTHLDTKIDANLNKAKTLQSGFIPETSLRVEPQNSPQSSCSKNISHLSSKLTSVLLAMGDKHEKAKDKTSLKLPFAPQNVVLLFFFFVFVFLALPFTQVMLTYVSAYFYEYSKTKNIEIIYKNLASTGSIFGSFYTRLPFLQAQYVSVYENYYFFDKHISLSEQEWIVKRKFAESIKDQKIDPILFEKYVDELGLYERNLKFVMADLGNLDVLKKATLGPLFDLTFDQVSLVSLLKNISYDISKSVKGETKSRIAIVFANDKKPLGFGSEIAKIVTVDIPYDENSIVVWEGSDIGENTTKEAKIDSPYSLTKYSGNTSWYLRHAMWSMSYDESFSMLDKLITEKQKGNPNDIAHIIYIDKSFLESIGLDLSESDKLYSKIVALITYENTNELLTKSFKEKHIMFWSKDENLTAEAKSTIPFINNFKCEACHKDMFGVYETFKAEKGSIGAKINVDISFQEGVVKHKLVYKIEDKSVKPDMLRVLIPQESSSGVVTLKNGDKSREVIPVVEASSVGKSIVLLQNEITRGDTDIVFSWESKKELDDNNGRYQLILKHQPGSLLEYELNITGLPVEPNLTDGFVLTDEGNYTYNTLLSGDRLLEIEFDSK